MCNFSKSADLRRPTEMVALRLVAVGTPQELELSRRFNAFCKDRKTQPTIYTTVTRERHDFKVPTWRGRAARS